MTVAVFQCRTEQDLTVIKQRSFGFLLRLHSLQQIRELLDMPSADLFILGHILFFVPVMRNAVERTLATDERKSSARLRVAEHERGHSSRIGPERQHHDVQHQFHMLRMFPRDAGTGTRHIESSLIDPALLW